MKILVIGGTGFIGPHLVRTLAQMGHSVSVFNRGTSHVDLPAEQILGDRRDLVRLRPQADVVIDLILSSGVQAQSLIDVFRGTARRVVAASSIDVYRACGVLHGSEEAYLEPVPLTEESPLRTKLQTYPPAQLKMLQGIFLRRSGVWFVEWEHGRLLMSSPCAHSCACRLIPRRAFAVLGTEGNG